jgi:hypothetical protein
MVELYPHSPTRILCVTIYLNFRAEGTRADLHAVLGLSDAGGMTQCRQETDCWLVLMSEDHDFAC